MSRPRGLVAQTKGLVVHTKGLVAQTDDLSVLRQDLGQLSLDLGRVTERLVQLTASIGGTTKSLCSPNNDVGQTNDVLGQTDEVVGRLAKVLCQPFGRRESQTKASDHANKALCSETIVVCRDAQLLGQAAQRPSHQTKVHRCLAGRPSSGPQRRFPRQRRLALESETVRAYAPPPWSLFGLNTKTRREEGFGSNRLLTALSSALLVPILLGKTARGPGSGRPQLRYAPSPASPSANVVLAHAVKERRVERR